MSLRSLVRVLLLLAVWMAATLPAHAQADDNPYRKAKVGQWVEYSSDFGGQTMTMRQTVTAKDEKFVTVKTEMKMGPNAMPAQEQKISLEEPFDPAKMARNQNIPNAKIETKQLDKSEDKIEVGGKTYTCTRVKIQTNIEVSGQKIESVATIWTNPDVPLSGMVRLQTETMGQSFTMDLKGFGDK
ncbi:MAG TPA: hypothetical protein PKD86_09070 [Gemmatales bacterium]|nr:hypothetical protein [Gemmatales bacterium]HMP59489.1 hypothetical protein [Gemmatales bacterium]